MGVQFLSDMQYKHGHGLYFSTIDLHGLVCILVPLIWSGLVCKLGITAFSEDNR